MVKIVVIGTSGYVGQSTVGSLLAKKGDDEVSKMHSLVAKFSADVDSLFLTPLHCAAFLRIAVLYYISIEPRSSQ